MSKRILIGVTIDDSLQFHTGLPELLVREGWEVHVVAGPGRRISSLRKIPGISVHEIEMARNPSPLRDLAALKRWFSVLRTVRPDVTFIGTPKAALLGNVAGKVLGIKRRIYVLHGLRLETVAGRRRSILRLVERVTARSAHQVLVVSASLKALAIEEGILSDANSTVLGSGSCNGIDVPAYDRRTTEAERSVLAQSIGVDLSLPTIGFVGRLTRDKGLPELADALTILRDQGHLVQLLVVGGVDDDSGRVALDLLGLSGQRIVPVGYREDPRPFYDLMDVFCLPSLREGLPGVVLEAMASRVVVVGTDATGIVDLVRPGATGYLAQKQSAESLALSLVRAMHDGSASARMVENAYNMVSKEYNTETVHKRILRFVDCRQVPNARSDRKLAFPESGSAPL